MAIDPLLEPLDRQVKHDMAELVREGKTLERRITRLKTNLMAAEARYEAIKALMVQAGIYQRKITEKRHGDKGDLD